MAQTGGLKRKSFFVEERTLKRAKKALGVCDIGHWERGAHQRALDDVRRAVMVRHSAVVLSELSGGAPGRERPDGSWMRCSGSHACNGSRRRPTGGKPDGSYV